MSHSYPGLLITFEGLDYSGKSTQCTRLIEYLKNYESVSSKRRIIFLREPGGTKISERVRKILLDKYSLEMRVQTELLLFSAARAQVVSEIIIPTLRIGDIVVLDRFYDSTTAYQGYGRGIDLNIISTINNFVINGANPDLTFIVDVSIEEMIRRQKNSGLNIDRMEASGVDFFKRVQEGYDHLRKEFSNRIIRINGERSIEEIHKEIKSYVDLLLKQKYL